MDGQLALEAIQPCHIESIRKWRNEQMDVLRQSAVITPEEQQDYYEKNIWPDMRVQCPRNILLAYMDGTQLVGYGGLVHITWECHRAEVSFLLNPMVASKVEDYERYFSMFLRLVKALAFQDLGLQKIVTETYLTRQHHISVLERAGFNREGLLENRTWIRGEPVGSIIHGCIRTYER